MNIVFTEWDKALVYLVIFLVTFVFSFLLWRTLFNELDYHKITYTKKTKQRTLWLIYFGRVSAILWLHVLQQLLLRLQH
jgi:hypothetical protein